MGRESPVSRMKRLRKSEILPRTLGNLGSLVTIFYLYELAAQPLFLLHKWKQEELCSYVNYGSATEMAFTGPPLLLPPFARSDGVRKR